MSEMLQPIQNPETVTSAEAVLDSAPPAGESPIATVLFQNVFPIGDTKVDAIPVKELGPAIGYYTQVLGFSLVTKETHVATLRRDNVTIGLSVNDDDPENASVYFDVRDVAVLHNELAQKGIEPTDLRIDGHGGAQYRVFFAKEPYGVCFCFGEPVVSAA